MPDGTQKEVDFIERLFRIEIGNDCPVSLAAAVLKPDKWGVKRVVSGRGLTDQDAVNGCMYEAIERQSAVFSDKFEIIQASHAELGNMAISPETLLQISDAQYANAQDWNSQVDTVHQLPWKLSEDHSIGWVEAKSLTAQTNKLLPAACCFLGYPRALEEGFPVPDSSGLATGQSFDDAVERALCELIERDAVSIWWYNQLEKPAAAIDPEKLECWNAHSHWMSRCDRQFWLLDLTHDLNIAVIAAVSCNAQGEDLSFGFAAARSLEKAAENAMLELVQFEATKKYYKPKTRNPYPDFLAWCRTARIRHHSFLRPVANMPGTAPALTGGSVARQLNDKNLEAFVVDLSGSVHRENVVRVVVPGLRPIWPRFAAGRLYDVPVHLGWRANPLLEAELNPTPILY